MESDDEPVALETAFGLQIVFDIQPRLLFPKIYETVEESVMARATELDRRLRGRTDAASVRKQRLLSAMAKRAQPANAP